MNCMASLPPASTDRCSQLLETWRSELELLLSDRERSLLAGELKLLDGQLLRLKQRHLRIAVFGRVGVGKSSLINALIGTKVVATDMTNGSTRKQQSVIWPISLLGITRVELIDTPGIDEIGSSCRGRLASRVAIGADLVLLVIDSDITKIDQEALEKILTIGKPIQLVLNRSDRWPKKELTNLLCSIRNRVSFDLPPVMAVSAAPRRPFLDKEGRVRSVSSSPQVTRLRNQLEEQLNNEGMLLLAIQTLRQADRFQESRKRLRLEQHKKHAQSLIGKYAAAKATGVAMNPIIALDLAGGFACDAALVINLCSIYKLPLSSRSARKLIKNLSYQNALLGGVQVGLTALKHLLLMLVPLSGGVSLAPAAPVALAQFALAVHASRRTGKIVAKQLLEIQGGQPGALLERLKKKDPVVRNWLKKWPSQGRSTFRHLLP